MGTVMGYHQSLTRAAHVQPDSQWASHMRSPNTFPHLPSFSLPRPGPPPCTAVVGSRVHGGGGWGSSAITHQCVHVLTCVCEQAVVVVVVAVTNGDGAGGCGGGAEARTHSYVCMYVCVCHVAPAPLVQCCRFLSDGPPGLPGARPCGSVWALCGIVPYELIL